MVELKDDKAVYLEIPYDYLCIYQQLLTYLADFGEDALRDCDSTCKGANKGIIQCWNMFQAAIASKALGRDKEASVLIKYIEAQLQLIYKGTDLDIYSAGELFPIDEVLVGIMLNFMFILILMKLLTVLNSKEVIYMLKFIMMLLMLETLNI